MPRRNSRRTFRSRGPRRKTAWFGGLTDPATLAPGLQSNVNLTTELPDTTENPIGKQGLTILRMFATLRINSTDANLSVEGSFGFIMVDGDAVAAAAFPDPFSDVEADWTFWDRRVFLPPSDAMQHMSIDSKAKRVFRGNDDNLMLIVQNDDAAQTLEFALGFRLLIGLP